MTLSPANKPHQYSLIFLHGLEMSAYRLSSVFLSDPLIYLLDDFKIHIPQAPKRPIAMNGGRIGESWFTPDIPSFNEANKKIQEMVENELKEIDNDPTRLFLGGFSQGSSLALYVGATHRDKIGGIVMFAGFMSKFINIDKDQEFPDIMVIHGDHDKMMPWGKAKRLLKTIADRPNLQTHIVHGMGHNLYSEEAKSKMYEFIRSRAPICK